MTPRYSGRATPDTAGKARPKSMIAADAKLLQNKYRHWQDWFNKLLES